MECNAPRGVCVSQRVDSGCAVARYAHQDEKFRRRRLLLRLFHAANLYPIWSYTNECFDILHVSAEKKRLNRVCHVFHGRIRSEYLAFYYVELWFKVFLVSI